MQQSGYLILADISGYTEFVTETEMDHGSEILKSLMQVVLDETRPPLKVQEIEGDAIFSYALTDSIDRGVLLVEMIEEMYGVFQTGLEDIKRNSTCTCRACASAGDLDMKFIVHHGAFTTRVIGGREGISGAAVILAHRLLKNHIKEKTSCSAYAFFSETAIEALGVEAMTKHMVQHRESYEHLGSVKGYVYNMTAYWEKVKAERQVVVSTEGAFLILSSDLPVLRTAAWEYYTNPRYREQWFFSDKLTAEGLQDGRYGIGTTEHCVHGKNTYVHKTLDWKPMRYVTQALVLPLDGLMPFMATFNEKDGQTHVTVVFGPPEHEKPLIRKFLRFMMLFIGPSMKKKFTRGADKYCELVREGASRKANPQSSK
jgi:hypothetical protein